MDPTQPPTPVVVPPSSPSNFSPAPRTKPNLLLWVLIGLLGAGAVTFALLTIVAFNDASKARTTVEAQKQAAAQAARDDQKKKDQQAAEIASQSPYRSYIAPLEFGSMEIKFPKNWSGYLQQSINSSTQLDLALHPNFVRRQNGVDDLLATRVLLIKRQMNDYLKTYDAQRSLTRKDITVSDIKGVQVTGKFQDKRTTRLVAVPVRDKTVVFLNEDSAYANEFDQILAQSKLLP